MRSLLIALVLIEGVLSLGVLRVAYITCDLVNSGINELLYRRFKAHLESYGIDVNGVPISGYELRRSSKIDFDVILGVRRSNLPGFDLSSFPLYSTWSAVLTLKENDKRRVALVVHGNPELVKIARSMGYRKVLKAENMRYAFERLGRKEVDAIFHDSSILALLSKEDRFRLISIPSPKRFVFVAYKKELPRRIRELIDDTVKRMVMDGEVKEVLEELKVTDYALPANVFEMANIEWPPYEMLVNGEWRGIDVDVLREVFTRIGFELRISHMPWARIIDQTRKGIIDGTFSLTRNEEREKFMYFTSEPLSSGVDFIFKRKDLEVSARSMADLPVMSCGYVVGYAYGDEFYHSSLRKVPVKDDRTGLCLLEKGRIDLFVVNLLVGKYYIRSMEYSDLEPFLKVGSRKYYYVAFPKTDPFYRIVADMISKELEEFKKSEEYIKILEKYDLSYEDVWGIKSF